MRGDYFRNIGFTNKLSKGKPQNKGRLKKYLALVHYGPDNMSAVGLSELEDSHSVWLSRWCGEVPSCLLACGKLA